uniref:hypothetical protein n=1 Tax=Salmonella enterica TaxID=28901 RepID=UPI00329995E4
LTLTPAATDWHRTVLDAAMTLWAPGGIAQIGALGSLGYGQARIDYTPDPSALPRWTDHLDRHRDEVLDLIQEMTG